MKTNGHDEVFVLANYDFAFDGILIINYMGNPIAVVGEDGTLIMRDNNYPIGLVDFLIENINMHHFWLN
jgi:hypothetical protein